MLAGGGYPWTVIPVERRTEYLDALEAASTESDIQPFTGFLAGLVGVTTRQDSRERESAHLPPALYHLLPGFSKAIITHAELTGPENWVRDGFRF